MHARARHDARAQMIGSWVGTHHTCSSRSPRCTAIYAIISFDDTQSASYRTA
jgi:hypothetical protein